MELVHNDEVCQTQFSNTTLYWIKQRLEDSEFLPTPDKPLEVVSACSYLKLKELAWEMYIDRIVTDTKLLTSFSGMRTLIPPWHIRNRLTAAYWDMDILEDDYYWSHYEENEFVFRRPVGRTFARVGQFTYYENGKIIDTYRMTIKKLPPKLSERKDVYFIEKIGDKLYFIYKEITNVSFHQWDGEKAQICVYEWNGKKVQLFLKHDDPKQLCNFDRCEYMRVHFEEDGYADEDCVSLVYKDYNIGRVCLKYWQLYHGFTAISESSRSYYYKEESSTVSNGIPILDGTYLFENKIAAMAARECLIYIDDFANIEAVYVNSANELIGVYSDREGYLDFYRLSDSILNMLQHHKALKRGDLLRSIKKNFDSDKVKRVYSSDSPMPWMIPRKVKTVSPSKKIWTWA